jgi:hypothetical protein
VVSVPTMCIRIPAGASDFTLHQNCPDGLWGSLRLLFSECQGSLGVMWLGHVVYHSPLSSTGVKNEWRYNSASSVCLHGVDRATFL